MIPIVVVACNKDPGLLGIDVLKVDTSKLINSVKANESNIVLLRGYKTSIYLKENHPPLFLRMEFFFYTKVGP